MKISFLVTGKTNHAYLNEGLTFYTKRIKNYCSFELLELKCPKTKSKEEALEAEKNMALKQIDPSDYLILLDEKGKEYNSRGFAHYLQKLFLHQASGIVFLAGGAYGFHQELYDRANAQLALSKMTYPHDLVRLIFLEQLYRSFTILKNLPYHH